MSALKKINQLVNLNSTVNPIMLAYLYFGKISLFRQDNGPQRYKVVVLAAAVV